LQGGGERVIAPTREEWEAAQKRLVKAERHGGYHRLTEAILGPCPPEPAPPPWYCGSLAVTRDGGVWVGFAGRHEMVTPAEADAMAAALIEHARYVRKQGDDSWRSDEEAAALIDAIKEPAKRPPTAAEADACGMLLMGRAGDTWDTRCQRPPGHAGACKAVGA
jgi:hypothetical protein